MNKLELQKKAVEVRKGIVTGVYNAKSGHPRRLIISSRPVYLSLFRGDECGS